MDTLFDLIHHSLLGAGTLLHLVMTGLAAFHLLSRSREPRSSLLWLVAIWSIPFFGVLLYMMFGVNRVATKTWRRQVADQAFDAHGTAEEPPTAYWHCCRTFRPAQPFEDPRDIGLNQILDRVCGEKQLHDGNDVILLNKPLEAIDTMLAAIAGARHHIHLASYIIGDDQTGAQLMDALTERARAGVQVRLLYDSYGSLSARTHGFFKRYRGIPNLHTAPFSHADFFKARFQANIRNHRKILVVDGRTAFLGGINFYDVYQPGPTPLDGALDYHFQVTGPCVADLQYTFLRDWHYMTDEAPERLLDVAHFPPCGRAGNMLARVQNSGPTADEHDGSILSFFGAISTAKRQVLLITPYFVPSEEIACALRVADMRGVDVRILVPEVNNHPTIAWAAQAHYARLLAAGVEIYERRPPFIHAKALLVDDRIALVGSANLDNRSLRLNYETNLVVFDPGFAAGLKQTMLAEFAAARRIDLNLWEKRPLRLRLRENVSNLLHPAL